MQPIAMTVLGATGSIGTSTLDLVKRHPERFRVYALTAHERVDALADLCLTHRPSVAVVGTAEGASRLTALLRERGCATEVGWGPAALRAVAVAPEAGLVIAAIVGAAGLDSTMAAAQAGKRLLLANKEALVMAGALLMDAVAASGAHLLPLDSEHNAIFQCLPVGANGWPSAATVHRLILTASGGPFRQRDPAGLHDITPDQACAHPNWVMGRKISVDSATMMNKGLEVIEARWLFGVSRASIDVVVHPQSVIHSMVEFTDGSVVAQLGTPDMRTPISYALAYPERIASGAARLDFSALAGLSFEPPNLQRFPCLGHAYDALEGGVAAPIVLNAANEIAVAAFLDGKLRFTDIASLVGDTLDAASFDTPHSLADVLAVDAEARSLAVARLQTRVLV